MTRDYWIQINPAREIALTQLDQTLEDTWQLHLWITRRLKDIWLEKMEIPTANELSKLVTVWKKGNKRTTQRYTLNRAIEKAITQFKKELITVYNDRVKFPPEIEREEYTDFNIQSRKIWNEYMIHYGFISTVYGQLFLDTDWAKTLLNQFKEMKVHYDYFPFLCHSATLQKENRWKIRFNFHPLESAQGRLAQRILKKDREI